MQPFIYVRCAILSACLLLVSIGPSVKAIPKAPAKPTNAWTAIGGTGPATAAGKDNQYFAFLAGDRQRIKVCGGTFGGYRCSLIANVNDPAAPDVEWSGIAVTAGGPYVNVTLISADRQQFKICSANTAPDLLGCNQAVSIN